MLKLMKYLKKSAGSIVLIIGLLFLQAYCDLSLPDCTSKIINVGIQQKGIEDGVPEKIRESSLENLQLFMSQEDKTEISNAYKQEDGIYVLHDDITKEERENLNEIFCKPMLMLSGFSSDSEESQEMRSQMGIPEGADPAEVMAQRISTILHADRIIVLDDGHMAGMGTHAELIKNCEVYRQIAMSQLSEEELA